jgi:hypothetical protein
MPRLCGASPREATDPREEEKKKRKKSGGSRESRGGVIPSSCYSSRLNGGRRDGSRSWVESRSRRVSGPAENRGSCSTEARLIPPEVSSGLEVDDAGGWPALLMVRFRLNGLVAAS